MRLKKITALFLTGALILSMAGCAGNGSKDKKEGSAGNEAQEPVKIATKPMTEQFILGEMLKKLIEEKAGYEVELTKGIGGGTSNIQPAMEKGEFDLYPEYTSSGWILVLGHKAGEASDDKMLAKLQEEYEEKFDMTWVGLYGQNNTYAVVVREDTARNTILRHARIWRRFRISLVSEETRIISRERTVFRGCLRRMDFSLKRSKILISV